MADTLIIPAVFASAVNEKLGTTLRWGNLASDFSNLVPGLASSGDTMHFPTIKHTATVEEVVKGTDLTPATLDMSDSTAILKYIASAFRIYDKDVAQVKGDVINSVVTQVSDVMSKAIDTDIAAEADKAIYKSATAAADKITSAEIQTALDNFGDDMDTSDFAAIVINSKLRSSFAGMDEFVNTAKTYQEDGNGIVSNGVVGSYFGIPVVMCNNGTYDSVAKECKSYIVKKGALGRVFQKHIKLENQRAILKLATDYVASSIYATRLMDNKGIVVVRKTIA